MKQFIKNYLPEIYGHDNKMTENIRQIYRQVFRNKCTLWQKTDTEIIVMHNTLQLYRLYVCEEPVPGIYFF